jgi:DedD protein
LGYNPRLDTALRNRLTGAVILVLLAVLLLPELLTGSGRNPAPAPVADSGSGPPRKTYRVDLSGDATAPASATSAAPAPVPTPGLNDVPVELPVPVASTAPARPVAEPVETPPPADTPPPAAAPPPADTPPPTAAPQPQVAPQAAATAPDGRKYFVQVGTFTTRERAEVLRSDLARRRFEVSINETARDTQRFYRVRVGPVADRKAAEALEVRLRPLAPDRAIVAVP